MTIWPRALELRASGSANGLLLRTVETRTGKQTQLSDEEKLDLARCIVRHLRAAGIACELVGEPDDRH